MKFIQRLLKIFPAEPKRDLYTLQKAIEQLRGKTLKQIEVDNGREYNNKNKNYCSQVLSDAIKRLGVSKEYLQSQNITIKTIRCNPKFLPRQTISLKGFDYNTLAKEEWKDSLLYAELHQLYFVILISTWDKAPSEKYFVESGFLFKPTLEELDQIRKDWTIIVEMIACGKANELSGAYGEYLQSRPKAKNSNDTVLAPGGHVIVRKGFFLKAKFVQQAIKRELRYYGFRKS